MSAIESARPFHQNHLVIEGTDRWYSQLLRDFGVHPWQCLQRIEQRNAAWFCCRNCGRWWIDVCGRGGHHSRISDYGWRIDAQRHRDQ